MEKINYLVTFIKYFEYEVEVETDENGKVDFTEVHNKAYRQFCADMRSPIADTSYDDCDVEEIY